MNNRFSIKLATGIAILFACSTIPAFANRGGGGGGSHSGGGVHGGGGGGSFHSSGGGYRGGPAAAGAGYSRGTASGSSRPSNSYQRPGAYSSRLGGNSAAGSQRTGNSSSAGAAIADGRWHSFGGASGSRGPESPQSGIRSSSDPGSGWHVSSANRTAGATGAPRSFSGQGGEVWENAPAARNVVPASRALSNIQGSLRSSGAVGAGFRGNASFAASSRFAGGSTLLGNRSLSGSVATIGRLPIGSSFRFGSPFGFGRGCWNCGFGVGFGGWGLGFGGGGFGFWNPFWFDPWWGPGPSYGYGYYGYPNSNVYGYPDSGPAYQNDNSNPPEQENELENQEPVDGNWVMPNAPNPSSAQNSANLNVPVLIYLKNGAVQTVRDYWIVDEKLHYILINGVQNTIDLAQVDLPRTNTENAKSGVKFIFKSEPGMMPAEPDAIPVPPGTSAPVPTQQINAIPAPEART